MLTVLKDKLKKLHTFYSTYVMYFLVGIAAWWLQLPLGEQQNILASIPWLKWAAPFVGMVMFLIARGLPQKPKSP